MKSQDQTQLDRQARDIFLRAIELHQPEAQAACLEGACQHDPVLSSRVEALMGNHRKDSFLEIGAVSGPPTVADRPTSAEGPGTVIGRYTLLQMIGEGGFGAVYMAEQKEPVRRRVALKIIKLGMDSCVWLRVRNWASACGPLCASPNRCIASTTTALVVSNLPANASNASAHAVCFGSPASR